MKFIKKLCLATALCLSATISTNASQVNAVRTLQEIYLDETLVSWKVYNVNDQNYVRLADLCPTVGTSLTWDSAANAVRMTSNGMTAEKPNSAQEDFSETIALATAYHDVISSLKASYGTLDSEGLPTATGLYFAMLHDFDRDGVEELLVSYVSSFKNSPSGGDWSWTTELYTYSSGTATKTHTKSFDFSTGSTADFGTKATIIADDQRSYLCYFEFSYHMYSNSEELFVYDFLGGSENLYDYVKYSDVADNSGSTFKYSIRNTDKEISSGSFKAGEKNFSAWDYTQESYQTFETVCTSAIARTCNYAETETLLARWITNPQTKEDIHAVETKQTIYLDDNAVDWLIYNINDENYIRLADLCPEIGVGLTWDSVANAVRMTTDGTSVPVSPSVTTEVDSESNSPLAKYGDDMIFISFDKTTVIDDGENWIVDGVITSSIYRSAEYIESLKVGDVIGFSIAFEPSSILSGESTPHSVTVQSTSMSQGKYISINNGDLSWTSTTDGRYYLGSITMTNFNPMTIVESVSLTIPKTVELIDNMASTLNGNDSPSDIQSFYGSDKITLRIDMENGQIVTLTQQYHP